MYALTSYNKSPPVGRPDAPWRPIFSPFGEVVAGDGPEAWGRAVATGVPGGVSYFFCRCLEATLAATGYAERS